MKIDESYMDSTLVNTQSCGGREKVWVEKFLFDSCTYTQVKELDDSYKFGMYILWKEL